MARFEWDPSTVKVDWALDGPVPWARAPELPPGTVHIADSLDELSLTGGQVGSGLVPERPFLLVGQMGMADPTRVPDGARGRLGVHPCATTRPGRRRRGPARGPRGARTWDEADLEAMAERIEARIESRAPGFRDRVTARRVLAPRELEALDRNLVGGAINGGTAGLHQQLVFRPVAGSGPCRDAGQGPLPRLGVRAPRRRGTRGVRGQRRPGRPVARPHPTTLEATMSTTTRVIHGSPDARLRRAGQRLELQPVGRRGLTGA